MYAIKIGKSFVVLIAGEEKNVNFTSFEHSASKYQFKETAKKIIEKRKLQNARIVRVKRKSEVVA